MRKTPGAHKCLLAPRSENSKLKQLNSPLAAAAAAGSRAGADQALGKRKELFGVYLTND
jgi:hypothetical protein